MTSDRSTKMNSDPSRRRSSRARDAHVADLVASNAKLLAELAKRDATSAVDGAITSHKLLPAQKDWALEYAIKDPAGFQAYVDKTPEVFSTEELGSDAEPPDPDDDGWDPAVDPDAAREFAARLDQKRMDELVEQVRSMSSTEKALALNNVIANLLRGAAMLEPDDPQREVVLEVARRAAEPLSHSSLRWAFNQKPGGRPRGSGIYGTDDELFVQLQGAAAQLRRDRQPRTQEALALRIGVSRGVVKRFKVRNRDRWPELVR